MQSSMITIRALSRLMKNKFSTFLEPAALQRANPHFISVVCGFPKDLRSKYRVGKFGDDAWFTSTNKGADVIGKHFNLCKTFVIRSHPQQRERDEIFLLIIFISLSRFVESHLLRKRKKKTTKRNNFECYARF